MNKKLTITLATLVLLTAACGQQANYRAPIMPPADQTVEEKATQILLEEDNGVDNQVEQVLIQKKYKGISVRLSEAKKDDGRPTSKTIATIQVSTSAGSTCETSEFTSDNFSLGSVIKNDILKTVNVKDLGRLMCLDLKCRDMIVMIDMKKGTEDVDVTTGYVLLKNDGADRLTPVVAQSGEFLSLLDAENGQESCEAEVSDAAAKAAADQAAAKELSQNTDGMLGLKADKDAAAKAAAAQEAAKAKSTNTDGMLGLSGHH